MDYNNEYLKYKTLYNELKNEIMNGGKNNYNGAGIILYTILDNQLYIILTLEVDHKVSKKKLKISSIGGSKEKEDKDERHTIIRELYEEVFNVKVNDEIIKSTLKKVYSRDNTYKLQRVKTETKGYTFVADVNLLSILIKELLFYRVKSNVYKLNKLIVKDNLNLTELIKKRRKPKGEVKDGLNEVKKILLLKMDDLFIRKGYVIDSIPIRGYGNVEIAPLLRFKLLYPVSKFIYNN
jgi:hypothetical protein